MKTVLAYFTFLITILFNISLIYHANGQGPMNSIANREDISVISKTYGDSIIIRWAPAKPFIWELGNQHGYIVTRLTIGNDSVLQLENRAEKHLTTQPLQPAPLSEWEPIAMENTNAALAAQAIYGEFLEFTNKADQMGGLVNKARTMENKFSLALFAADQSVEVARLHGLRFVDSDIKQGYKYLYRVTLAGPEKSAVDSGYVYQAVNDTFPIPRPRGLQAEFGNQKVELRWNKRDFRNIFSGYEVERSTGKDQDFTVVNDLPFINPGKGPQNAPKYMYYTDSLPENTREYIYRVRGRTPFGELSPPSDTVRGRGKAPKLALNPAITKKEVTEKHRVKIHWKLSNPDQLNLKGFQVLRSSKASGSFSVVHENPIGPEVFSFIDNDPLPTNYYRVKVLGAANRQATTFPVMVQLPDSIPPVPPENLTGYIDTAGVVTLHWQSGNEEEVTGYRLLKANTPESEFMPVSDNLISGLIYKDTIAIKTLSKNIYYRVLAVDQHFNRSYMSPVLALTRPDVVAPSSPAFTGIQNNDSSIVLHWQSSSSEDVGRQVIYRKRPLQSKWQLQADLPADHRHYEDEKVNTVQDYQYRIIAVDNAGLESQNNRVITAATIDRGVQSPVRNFYSKVDRTAKKVELAWVYKQTNVERFVIYRKQPSEQLSVLKTVSGNKTRFIDQQLTVNSEYGYRIQAVFADGGKSPVSKLLKVKY